MRLRITPDRGGPIIRSVRVPLLLDVWLTLLTLSASSFAAGALAVGLLPPDVLADVANQLVTDHPRLLAAAAIASVAVALVVAWSFERTMRRRIRQRLAALVELAELQPGGTILNLADALERGEGLTEQISLKLGAAATRLDTEQARSRSGAALFETAFRSMQDGLVVVAADGRVVLANPAAQPMLNVSEEPAGRPLEEVVRSVDAQRLVAAAMQGQTAQGEFTLTRQSRIVQATAVPLPTALAADAGSGTPALAGGVVLVMRDVTELRAADQNRREFTSNVSHELKTPVTTVRAYVDTLQQAAAEGALESDTAVLFLSRIDEQAERLSELIGNLMTLAQIDAPGQAVALSEVDVPSVVGQVVDDLRILAERKAIALTADLEVDAPVRADREGLRSLAQNLIRNAIQHTPHGGTIRVAAAESPGTVRLSVADDGVGIPRDAQERLFERFYRVDSARTRDRGGSGLGLAIVSGLVQRYGGRIEVDSELDVGSTFTVTLPKAD